MWVEFYLAAVLCILSLYCIGYVFLRALNFSRTISICAAPLASTAFFCTVPIVLDVLAIPCSPLSVLAPPLVVSGILYALLLPWRSRHKPLSPSELLPITVGKHAVPYDLLMLFCYIVPSLLVSLLLFVGTLLQPDVVNCQYDNQTHINVVRAFLDSGQWSTLHVNSFLAAEPGSFPYMSNTGGFYPAAWHDLVAIVCSLTRTSVPIATNAVVFALSVTAFPTGLFLLMRAMFPRDQSVVSVGAIMTSSIATWPWIYLIKGPRYPNLLGIILMTSALAVIMIAVESNRLREIWLSFSLFCLFAVMALSIAHPNTVFSAYIILAAYGGHVIWKASDQRTTQRRICYMTLYSIAIASVWVIAYQLPFFKGVLSYRWNEHAGLIKALISLFTLSATLAIIQIAPAIVSGVGAIACCRQRRVWMLLPLVFFSLCFVATRVGWEDAKYWLAGMWYQSPDRFAALISVWVIPLGSMGIVAIIAWLRRRGMSHKAIITTLVVFCMLNYVPMAFALSLDNEYGFSYGRTRDLFERIVGTKQEHMYSPEEVQFVERVKELLPKDALVLNQPNDGSMFAYGANELNTYFRSTRSDAKQTDDAKVIRTHLDELATNKKVQQAVRDTGTQYLLLLDKDVPLNDATKSRWMAQYRNKNVWNRWRGINNVDDDTPGFETVLAEGDEMRLYKLTLP